jgi:hypothetical protein
MAIKLVPGGHPYHALAEAAANAAKEADIVPEAVESITVSRPGAWRDGTGEAKLQKITTPRRI